MGVADCSVVYTSDTDCRLIIGRRHAEKLITEPYTISSREKNGMIEYILFVHILQAKASTGPIENAQLDLESRVGR